MAIGWLQAEESKRQLRDYLQGVPEVASIMIDGCPESCSLVVCLKEETVHSIPAVWQGIPVERRIIGRAAA